MTTIKSKDFHVHRATLFELGEGIKRIIAFVAPPEYRVLRDDTRNKAFPDAVGYKIVYIDPERALDEEAAYYVDYHPKSGQFIFVQGKDKINMRVVYATE